MTEAISRRLGTSDALRWLIAAALCALLGSCVMYLALWAGRTGPGTSRAASVASALAPGRIGPLPVALRMPASAALGAANPRYRVLDSSGALRASNPAQRLAERFTSSAISVTRGQARVEIALRAVGNGAFVRDIAPVRPTASANRVSYAYPGLEAWFANGPAGLEQGFTVTRGYARGARTLTLTFALAGNMRPALVANGHSLTLDGDGSKLRYEGLSTIDATGRALASSMRIQSGLLQIRVDARGARFPLHIDPFIQSTQVASYGCHLALSGDASTALITDCADEGKNKTPAVFAFTRSGETWSLDEQLVAPGYEGGIGPDLALSANGQTALLGDEHYGSHGAVWVFTRSGSTWSQQGEKLTPSEVVESSNFGASVALSSDGNTALVGCGSNVQSAAYVFTRSGSTWTQQGGALTVNGVGNGSYFGYGVALSGDGNTALIGAPFFNKKSGGAWVFTRKGATWSQQGPMLAAGGKAKFRFGWVVALSSGTGDTALIGGFSGKPTSQGAWVFTRSGETWTEQGSLKPPTVAKDAYFGNTVALSADGNRALVGAPGLGQSRKKGPLPAVYVFARSGASWDLEETFMLHGETESDSFGLPLAVSADGNLALVGSFEATWAFVDPPTVSEVSPAEGSPLGGTEVTITGTNLSGASAVDFGSSSATSYTVNSAHSITAVSPPGTPLESVNVTVTTSAGTSSPSPHSRFTYGA